MATRIYQLAKDLRIDSKQLVDLCSRIGIEGKGSALARLEADETAKIIEHFERARQSFEEYIKQSPTNVHWTGKGLSIIPEILTNSKDIVELDLSHNQIGLSDDSLQRISNITSLRTLKISGNSIRTIPSSFGNLVNLEHLDLSRNFLSEIPDSLKNLRNLKSLHIGGNSLATIPIALLELKKLAYLNASHNTITAIPYWLPRLSNLRHLILSMNKLKTLTGTLSELRQLNELRLDSNHLTSLPDSICKCLSLTILTANRNFLEIFPKGLTKCEYLNHLELNSNKIREIPDEISSLSNLTTLQLSGNQISSLPNSIGFLSLLALLDLSRNCLEWLPVSIKNLLAPQGRLEQLYLHDNPELRLPPEILGSKKTSSGIGPSNSAESVLKFYFRRESGPRRKIREAKILIVGQGGVGKSSIAKQLLDPSTSLNQKETQTNGIDILRWSVAEKPDATDTKQPAESINGAKVVKDKWLKRKKRRINAINHPTRAKQTTKDLSPIRVNVWDFGGQEIMHSTHQFFLTQRSLYLLVLDARSGEHDGNLHGWLKIIQGFGGLSPVLIVVNKCEPPHHLQLDKNRLMLDYFPNLKGIHYVSCANKEGMKNLRETIEQQIIDLPHVNDEMPETYFDVKLELEVRAQSEDFITQERYKAVCQKNHIHDDEAQRDLLQFLHDLGSLLHYDDPRQHYLVYDTNVLNPKWVTNGVYKILMNHTLRLNGDGKLFFSDLDMLLGDAIRYPRERHRFLVDLMRKFDMCFAFAEDPGQLLVPELLSPNEPDIGWDIGELLNFQFHYSVLPRGLLPRFIVRTHHLLTKNRTYWRSGVVLAIEGCRVAIRGDARASIVYIQIQGGSPAGRRRALSIVRDHFTVIHSSMPRLEVIAKIPLPGESKAPAVDFAHLCRLEEMGQDLYWFEGSDKQWSIRQLLDGTIDRQYDVFLCHNKLDKPIAKMLSGILRDRGIRPWLDVVDLTPGEPWQSEIVKAISACRTIIVLMGESGSGIWQIEEVRLALSEAASLKKRVIPIGLPGVDRSRVVFPPEFRYLDQRTWVMFESDFDDESITKLCKGIIG